MSDLYKKLSLPALKFELQHRKLQTDGKKAELIERLLNSDKERAESGNVEDEEADVEEEEEEEEKEEESIEQHAEEKAKSEITIQFAKEDKPQEASVIEIESKKDKEEQEKALKEEKIKEDKMTDADIHAPDDLDSLIPEDILIDTIKSLYNANIRRDDGSTKTVLAAPSKHQVELKEIPRAHLHSKTFLALLEQADSYQFKFYKNRGEKGFAELSYSSLEKTAEAAERFIAFIQEFADKKSLRFTVNTFYGDYQEELKRQKEQEELAKQRAKKRAEEEKKRAEKAALDIRSLHISNLPQNATKEILEEMFADATEVDLPMDKDGKCKRFATLLFSDEAMRDECFEKYQGAVITDGETKCEIVVKKLPLPAERSSGAKPDRKNTPSATDRSSGSGDRYRKPEDRGSGYNRGGKRFYDSRDNRSRGGSTGMMGGGGGGNPNRRSFGSPQMRGGAGGGVNQQAPPSLFSAGMMQQAPFQQQQPQQPQVNQWGNMNSMLMRQQMLNNMANMGAAAAAGGMGGMGMAGSILGNPPAGIGSVGNTNFSSFSTGDKRGSTGGFGGTGAKRRY